MSVMRYLGLLGLAALVTSCGTLMPKRVELFQDKVQSFPEAKAKELETQRQAAQRVAQTTAKALISAVAESASTNVVTPIGEAARVSDSVSRSLGPPLRPSTDSSEELAQRLDSAVAKLNSRIDEFKAENDANAGKKIEDTGLLKVPYFVWLGGVLVLGFITLIVAGVIWTALKMWAMANPPVALGLNAVQAGASFAKNALAQVLRGGEKFKEALSKEIQDPALQERLKELFRVSHQTSQDEQVQAVVKELTK